MQQDRTPGPENGGPHTPRRRSGQEVTCGWCGTNFVIPARGRVPKWCSATCRHRAWEQRRAAASGLSAVEVVTQRVEVAPSNRSADARPPSQVAEWVGLLDALAQRLDTGRLYQRDLPTLAPALQDLVRAFNRRIG